MAGTEDVALAALGPPDTRDDWQLKPSTHAKLMTPAAGPLQRVLEDSHLEEVIEIFESADKAAGAARDRYKRLAHWSAVLSFAAVILAAVLLLASARALGLPSPPSWLAAVQGVCLVLSVALSLALSRGYFETWMQKRAVAEHHREKFFHMVTAPRQVEHHAGELDLLRLQLAYFRRYQLDVQRKYYRERGAQHAAALSKSNRLRLIAILLIALAASPVVLGMFGINVVQILPRSAPDWTHDTDLQQRLFLALSTSGAALQGLLAAFALINQDERNATRYQTTAKNLDEFAERPLDEAMAAAESGNEMDVRAYIAIVQDHIAAEHREWLQICDIGPEKSLARMKEQRLPVLGR